MDLSLQIDAGLAVEYVAVIAAESEAQFLATGQSLGVRFRYIPT